MDFHIARQMLVKFMRDQEGMTMVEYAVAGGVITVAAVAAFIALGGSIESGINRLTTRVGS
ncbi:Flp/Fap pilin component [compost metagenome]